MLTENQIKQLIVRKLYRIQGCRDKQTIIKYIHIFRGMLMVLLEKDPGDLDNVPDILEKLEIPHHCVKNEYFIDDVWLLENKIT